MKKTLVLCILDGVGMKKEKYGNALKQADPKFFQELIEKYPHSLLEASGKLVGLPEGQMGNSEVGHMNIGAGRIVYQPLEFINKAIEDKTFYENKEFLSVINHVKNNNSKLHLVGLVSDGGIHSHINHLLELLVLAKNQGVKEVYIHAFLDGRDTLPRVATTYLDMVSDKCKELKLGKIATISGRYYAMDRDNRWDRVELAYNNMTKVKEQTFDNYKEVIDYNYSKDNGDEFVVPAQLDSKGIIEENDGVIFFNFRPDRLKEIGASLTNPEFKDFERPFINNLKVVTLMPVAREVICTNAFKLENLVNTFGEYISSKGLTQLRIAETEKYAHVTYFFDGGVEKDIPNCDRVLIPSPKVATYDLKPEMSANKITDELINRLGENKYDVVILNYANGDMVGHTGSMEATIKAITTVDKCLKRLYDKVNKINGTMMIIADHGNCDTMLDNDGNVVTSHSTALVPCIITKDNIKLNDGKLGDVAPTLLELLGLEIPSEMSGVSLIRKD